MDRDAGVRGAEVGEHAEEVVGAGRVDAADPQLAAQQAGELLELGVQAVDLREHALCVAEDDVALGVSSTLRLVRRKTSKPSSRSSRLTCWEIADWER